MYRLADAIKSGNWNLQDDAIYNEEFGPTYFKTTLELLKSIDFNSVDIITIAYGTNDFTGKNAISSSDSYDIATFEGALRYSIETIQSAYPHIDIVVCTPIYRFWMDKENNYEYLYDSNTHEINGQKLTDFVQSVKNIADEYNLLCIDNYYDSGICYDNRTECFSSTDGTHPNEKGRQMIAENMAKELYKYFG